MKSNADQNLVLAVQFDWQSGTKGVLSSNDAKDITGAIHVGAHPGLGGEGAPWTPEHLYLSSINSSFMFTFIALAKKQQLSFTHFECNITGEVEMSGRKLRFTNVTLYPKVFIHDELLRKKATQALQDSYEQSLIVHSVNIAVLYRGEVLIDPHPPKMRDTDPAANQVYHVRE